ncbi:MAG: HYR domain-containing protein, partial [Acidobacteria bacterium]|nr:HYR domain-containing protein [Acidobacteriota bacterium]
MKTSHKHIRILLPLLICLLLIGQLLMPGKTAQAVRSANRRIGKAMTSKAAASALAQDKTVFQGKPEPPSEVSVVQYNGPQPPTQNSSNHIAAVITGTGSDVEPNGTAATASPILGDSARIRGNLYPNGDIDFYSFSATAGDRVYAATMTSGSAGSSTDSQLTLIASDGATTIEFDDDNGSFAGLSSSIAGATIPTTGIYYLKVNDFTAGTTSERPYELWLQVQSGAGAPTPEVESNDTPATANPLPANGWVSGTRNPAAATEQDWYSLTLNAGDTVFLSLDLNPERDGTVWNGRLGFALFGDANNQILVVDDAGTGDVSPVPNNPSEAMFFTVKNAGTYFAFVDSASAAVGGPTATYHLSVSVLPAFNEGVNCTTYTSTDVPKTIGPGTGLTSSTITVPGNPRIADINVEIVLNHALMQDIDAHLRSPAGNDNGLFTDIGAAATGGQTQMDLIFDDEAGIPPAFTALKGMRLKPENNATAGTASTSGAYRLSWFDGENAGGTWTLDLRDDTAGANGGTLTAWSLRICEQPPPAACPAGFTPITVFSTDFESGAAGFTHSGTQDEWELGLPATLATTTANPIAAFNNCNSGVNCWKTDLDNTYNASSNQDLLSPNINLAGLSGPITVTWAMRHQIETANFDHMFVDFQQAGGATPVRLYEWLDPTPISASAGTGNPQANIGGSIGWGLFSRRADSLAGLNTELRFHLDSDTTVQFGGLAVDDVTVTACQPCPAITCPANITTGADPNQCSAVVNYTPPISTGCTVTCTPGPGFAFQKGTTTVTCTNGATSTCSFTVTVNDTQSPSITCPANITTNTAPGQCSAVVTYTTPTPTDNCPGSTASCTPPSGSTFQKGTTTVTCTATDASNLTSSCSFTVTVVDNQAPTVTCPANISGVPSGVVTYMTPTANDNCPGSTVVCAPASGSSFPVGTTTVTCTATDAANLTGSCTFTVTTTNPCTITCPA